MREEKKGDCPEGGIRQICVNERVSMPSTPTPSPPKQETLAANAEEEKDSAQESHNEAILYANK
jgi:hypothetical protein